MIRKLIYMLIVVVMVGTACSNTEPLEVVKEDETIAQKEPRPPLVQAIIDRDYEALRELVSTHKESINQQDEYGSTPLHTAILFAEGNMEPIELLVENGADFTIKDEYGISPFFLAVDLSFIKAIHYFLDRGANPNDVNDFNESPMMMFALRAGIPTDVFMEITERMVREGADLTVEDINGNTFYSYLELVQFEETIKEVYRLFPPTTVYTYDVESEIKKTLIDHPDTNVYKTIYGDYLGCPASGMGAMVVSQDGVIYAINGIAIGYYKHLPRYEGEYLNEYISACAEGEGNTEHNPIINS